MILRTIERAAAAAERPDLQRAARAYARAKRCAVIHGRLIERACARYGEPRVWVSGIGADHFPTPVKIRARSLCAAMRRFLAEGDAERPRRVRHETMRHLFQRVRARFPPTYYSGARAAGV